MKKIYISFMSVPLAAVVLLTACGYKKDGNTAQTNGGNNIFQNDSSLENTIPSEDAIDIEKNCTEEEIIEYFENMKEEIYNNFSSGNINDFKENIKKSIIDGIDFIFYGKEIKGITFEELSKETKEKITRIVAEIDMLIESKKPGYKEEIKSSFGRFKDATKSNISSINEVLNDFLGDSYDDLKNFIESTGELGIDIAEIGLDSLDLGFTYIKNWYENETDKR